MEIRGRWPVILLAGLYFAFQTRGLTITHIGGGITVTGGYFVVLLIAVFGALTLGVQEPLLGRRGTIGFILASSFLLLITFQIVRSPQPLRGWTLVGIQGMGLVIYLVAAAAINTSKQLRELNLAVYIIGSMLATVTLAGYVYIVLDPVAVFGAGDASGFENWQLIAMPANAILYRFTGFVGDPHFYVWYATPALIAGIVSVRGWRRVGVIPLSAGLLLSMSRTWFVIFPASVVFVYLVASLSGQANRLANVVSTAFGVFAGIAGLIVGVAVALRPASTWAWIQRRLFATALDDPRFVERWPILISRISEMPLLGYGSRSVEATLGVTAHSAYLGLLHDFGILGLMLWVSLLFLGLRATAQSLVDGQPEATPWIFAILLTFGMNLMLSFQYDLFVWMTIGVSLSNAMTDDKWQRSILLENSIVVLKIKSWSRILRSAYGDSITVRGTADYRERIGVAWRNSMAGTVLARVLSVEVDQE